MTGQEIAQAAAVKGMPVHAFVREQWAGSIAKQARAERNAAWARLPLDLRMALITQQTQRENIENAACMAWAAFTDDEQVKMGAALRRWLGPMCIAGCLR